MGEGGNELYNNQDIPESTGINPGIESSSDIQQEGFPDLQEVIPGYDGNNKKLLNNFLKNNSDLKRLLNNFLQDNNINPKEKILCKKKLKECKTDDDIKNILVILTPGGYRIGNEEIQNISDEKQTDSNQLQEREETSTNSGNEVQDFENQVQKREEASTNSGNEVQNIDEQVLEHESSLNEFNNDQETVEEFKNHLKEDLQNREQLLQGHADVKEITEKKAELAQQQIPEETRNQLKQKGYRDDDINNYILLRVTLNEVKGNPNFDKDQIEQFEKGVNELSRLDIIFKNLDNACNIPDTNFSSFSSESISQTRTELFYDKSEGVGNKSLRDFRDSRLESREYPEGFFDMNEDDIITQYGKFLPSENRWLLEAYDRQVEQNSLERYKDSEDYIKLLNAVTGIKEAMDASTKKMVEELCIISQIKGMYMCMGEGVNFDLNKANDIKLDKDGSMILDGHIDGVEFSIRQDITTSRLQSSQKIFKNYDNTLNINGKNNFVNSNFILPNQDNIFDFITDVIKKDSSLESANNQEDYIQNLQQNIMGNIDKKYSDTKYANFYMKEQAKSEKISQNVMGIIDNIGGLGKNNLTHTDGPLYDFFNTIHFNLQNMTSGEKELFGKCVKKLGELIHEGGNDVGSDNLAKDDKIAKFLGSKDRTTSVLQGINLGDDNLSFFDFFSFFYKESNEQRIGPGSQKMLNLPELWNLLNGNVSGYPIASGKFYNRNKDSDAEKFLEEELKNLTYFK